VRDINPIELAINRQKSRLYFQHARWHGKRKCPRCNYRYINRLSAKKRYSCKCCRYVFNDFTGTYLGRLRIPFDVISHLLYLFVLGVPAYRIRWFVSVSLATIEHAFRIFRHAIYDSLTDGLQTMKLSGKIEIDEALFGGRRRGGKRGWGSIEHKNLVFGIYKRNGIVITFPVSDRQHKTLIPLIQQHTRKGSLYYTDDHTAYATLSLIGKHNSIYHGNKEYVRENTHINGIEGFWSYAKTWLYNYRGVPRQYFYLYLKEVEFRFNNRNTNLYPIISKMLVETVSDV
jgi:transposase